VSARLYSVIDRVAVLRIELSLSCGIPTTASPTDDRLKRAGDGHAVRRGSNDENVSSPYVSILPFVLGARRGNDSSLPRRPASR
jgi:hypothetical protein